MALKAMAAKPDRSLFWLGKYLSLALTLPASVAAGYLLGTFADHHFHMPLLRAAGIVLGMAAGMIQVFQEISRDEKRK
jgi:F0F1-type ATP synthase assembly protein I